MSFEGCEVVNKSDGNNGLNFVDITSKKIQVVITPTDW